MKLYNSLSKLEQSVYRFEQFSSAGMEQEAAFEVGDLEITIEDIIQFSKFRLETVDVSRFKLKPKRKRTIYIWKTEPGACDDCKSLDGTEYERRADVPGKLHPNCKCEVEEIEIIEDIDTQDEEGDDAIIVEDDNDETLPKDKINQLRLKLIQLVKNLLTSIEQKKKAVEKIDLPAEYWFIGTENSIKNFESPKFLKLRDIKDTNLIRFIKSKYHIDNDFPTLIITPDEKLHKEILKSKEISDFAKKYYEDIANGKYGKEELSSKFWETKQIFLTIGKFAIYNPHIDDEGNLIFTIVDIYDFDWLNDYGHTGHSAGVTILNNLVFIQQTLQFLKNYVIIIPIRIKMQELL